MRRVTSNLRFIYGNSTVLYNILFPLTKKQENRKEPARGERHEGTENSNREAEIKNSI